MRQINKEREIERIRRLVKGKERETEKERKGE